MLSIGACASTYAGPSGCTTYWSAQSFPIIVSPDSSVSDKHTLWLVDAADVWNKRVGKTVFIVRAGAHQDPKDRNEAIFVAHQPLQDDYLGFCPVVYHSNIAGSMGRVWRGVCLLDSVKIGVDNRARYVKTAVHEFGHALGFSHDKEDSKSVMFPEVLESRQFLTPKHLDTVRKMMEGTYKQKTAAGIPRCF